MSYGSYIKLRAITVFAILDVLVETCIDNAAQDEPEALVSVSTSRTDT